MFIKINTYLRNKNKILPLVISEIDNKMMYVKELPVEAERFAERAISPPTNNFGKIM